MNESAQQAGPEISEVESASDVIDFDAAAFARSASTHPRRHDWTFAIALLLAIVCHTAGAGVFAWRWWHRITPPGVSLRSGAGTATEADRAIGSPGPIITPTLPDAAALVKRDEAQAADALIEASLVPPGETSWQPASPQALRLTAGDAPLLGVPPGEGAQPRSSRAPPAGSPSSSMSASASSSRSDSSGASIGPVANEGNPPPIYPEQAIRQRVEGTVIVDALVQRDGAVANVKVHTTSGSSLLDASALESVRGWRFQPASNASGNAVECRVRLPIRFVLTRASANSR